MCRRQAAGHHVEEPTMTPLHRPRAGDRHRARRALGAAGLAVASLAATTAVAVAPLASADVTAPPAHGKVGISQDVGAKRVTMTDGDLRLVLDYDRGATVSSFRLGDVELVEAGVYSTARTGAGDLLDSRSLPADPSVTVRKNTVTAKFAMAADDVALTETWTFIVADGGIDLQTTRRYDVGSGTTQVAHNGQLTFGWARIWDNIRRADDGGNIPLGNAYAGTDGFYLNKSGDRYGVEESDFVLLDEQQRAALVVEADSPDRRVATEFAYTGDGNTYQETQVSAAKQWSYTAGTKEEGYVYGGHSSNDQDVDIYSPVDVTDGQQDSVAFHFGAADYDRFYDLGGDIRGVEDPAALSSLLNDFGRSGIVDKDYGMSTVGMRYPGTGPYDLALSNRTVLGYFDPAMTASQQAVLEYFRDYAQSSDGHLSGRTYHRDHPWGDGSLADADPAYVLAAAELYEYGSDEEWVTSMRDSVRASIEFMVSKRYAEQDGLFTNDVTSCTSRKGLREWNDAYYVKYQSGYVNALMYGALTQWSDVERTVFQDEDRATRYADMAARLKERFNRDAADGGLWDPETGMFAYWRCPDGTAQAAVQHTQLNLQAIALGLVDVDRARQILDGIDEQMAVNHLEMLPENFLPVLPNTEEWSGDHFQSGLEDGAVYPFFTELYMRAAAFVGERERSLDYLDATLERYTEDGFVGWSFLDWSLEPRLGEAWFPSNANAAAGLFTSVLGIQPTGDGVVVAPNVPERMNGTTVTREVDDEELTVTYNDALDQTVRYSGLDDGKTLTVRWTGQEPGRSYTVRDRGRTTVVADENGAVEYQVTGKGTHRVVLTDGAVDGYVLATDVPTDLALGAQVSAASTWLDERWWEAENLVDGNRFSADGTFGWSSDGDVTANHTESVTLDLGAVHRIGRVNLLPRDYDGRDIGRGFPEGFTIETSADGEHWTTVVEEEGYAQPTTFATPTFPFDAVDGRYVRVTGTDLRQAENSEYRMQLAEIEVFAPTE
jgi:hypothetical protein